MQRWESEKDEDQPWNAVAASKHISDGKVCVGSGKTPSTVGQKGSVNEETKWKGVDRSVLGRKEGLVALARDGTMAE
jgi:hypothetical protein